MRAFGLCWLISLAYGDPTLHRCLGPIMVWRGLCHVGLMVQEIAPR